MYLSMIIIIMISSSWSCIAEIFTKQSKIHLTANFSRWSFMLYTLHTSIIFSPHLGILPPPNDVQINVSNKSVSLSWVAPESLQVSTPPTISHYVLSNNLTNRTETFNNPTTCHPLASCNYSFDLRDPFFTSVGTSGENATILDYNGAVEFKLFAVNGAGNGNAATCTYILQRKIPTG